MKKQIEKAVLKLQVKKGKKIREIDLATAYFGHEPRYKDMATWRNLTKVNRRFTADQICRLAIVLETDPNTLLGWTNFTNSQLTNEEK